MRLVISLPDGYHILCGLNPFQIDCIIGCMFCRPIAVRGYPSSAVDAPGPGHTRFAALRYKYISMVLSSNECTISLPNSISTLNSEVNTCQVT